METMANQSAEAVSYFILNVTSLFVLLQYVCWKCEC